MNTATQETMMDYTPTQEEEIARLTEQVARLKGECETLKESPALVEYKKAETKAKKITKTIESLGEKIDKAEKELRKLNAIKIDEPTENGFYMLTTKSQWRKEISINEQLFIRVFGDWLEPDGANWFRNDRWGRDKDFSNFLGIDEDTISATFAKIENLDEMPAELKVDSIRGFRTTGSDDEIEDDETEDEDED